MSRGEGALQLNFHNDTMMMVIIIQVFYSTPAGEMSIGDKYPVGGSLYGDNQIRLKLPGDVTCSQCVLQWTYKAGKRRHRHVAVPLVSSSPSFITAIDPFLLTQSSQSFFFSFFVSFSFLIFIYFNFSWTFEGLCTVLFIYLTRLFILYILISSFSQEVIALYSKLAINKMYD